MRKVLLLMLLPATPMADGDVMTDASEQVLREAESHGRELQRLHATDALLEIQLRIAKKLQECRQTGYPCPGVELIPSISETKDTPSPASSVDMPQLIGTYQGKARLRLDNGRQIEVRAGQRLGRWRIHAVGTDALDVQDPNGGLFRIPIEANTP